jgi:hypothetical protein
MSMRWITCVVAGAVILQGSCDSKGKKAFLDATFEVPPHKEWNKEVTAKRGGTISFRVTSQGPFAVTVITDKGRKALTSGAKGDKADILLTQDSRTPTAEGEGHASGGFVLVHYREPNGQTGVDTAGVFCGMRRALTVFVKRTAGVPSIVIGGEAGAFRCRRLTD